MDRFQALTSLPVVRSGEQIMRFSLTICVIALWINSSWARAEMTQREAQRFAVDITILKGGSELRGYVLQRDPHELKMAVQRDWLQARQPDLARQIEADTETEQAAAKEELVRRVKVWQDERAADIRLSSALKSELKRLAKPLAKQEPVTSQFVFVTLPAERVRRVFTAQESSRQLAKVAWEQQLPRVEDTLIGTLKGNVEKLAPDWQTTRVDLSDRLPVGQRQTEDEWAARQAIFEYEFRQKLDFQGTGKLIVRVGDGAPPPNLGELMTKAAADSLQGELSGLDLEGLDLQGLGLDGAGLKGATQPAKGGAPEDDWKQSVAQEAKTLDCRGFRVTRVPSLAGTEPAKVTTEFYARRSDGLYHVIWSHETITDPSKVTEDAIVRIQQDPQVQEVLKVANALSLGQNASQALRTGAAVQASMKEADDRFFEFRQRYNRTLDGPPLMTSKP